LTETQAEARAGTVLVAQHPADRLAQLRQAFPRLRRGPQAVPGRRIATQVGLAVHLERRAALRLDRRIGLPRIDDEEDQVRPADRVARTAYGLPVEPRRLRLPGSVHQAYRN